MYPGSEARKRMSHLQNGKKQWGCVPHDAFRGVMGTLAAGLGPTRQGVAWVPLSTRRRPKASRGLSWQHDAVGWSGPGGHMEGGWCLTHSMCLTHMY